MPRICTTGQRRRVWTPALAVALVLLAGSAWCATADHLLISQFVVKTRTPYTTFGSPFIAITNPTGTAIDLSDVYLTDATQVPATGYPNITFSDPANVNPGGGVGGDFHARFPDGYLLPAGATLAVALNGSQQYFTAYGRQPDFELFEEAALPDAVPELRAAFPGAIGAGLGGGGTNVPALSDISECIVLYAWDGVSDLVQDIDYVIWGTSTSIRTDKTGLSVGAGTYLNDTPVAAQIPVASLGPAFGHAFRRVSNDEGTETAAGGNGLTGHDETSENLATTWSDVTGSTPPPAPAVGFPAAPVFTAAAFSPAAPWAGLTVPLSVTVRSFSPLTDVTFHYSLDGGPYLDLAGVDAGNSQWTADVPAQDGGTVVTWYCTAANTAGGTAATPVCAPRFTKGWTVAASPPAAELRKAPYLIWPGDPARMKVLWQAGSTRPCTFEWGLDTGYGLGSVTTTEYGTDHQHTYTVTDLQPGRLYYYRVTLEGTPYPGSFRAAPPPDALSLKFTVYGDTRTNVAAHDAVVGRIMNSIAADPERQTMVAFVGDLVTDGDQEAVVDSEFFTATSTHVRDMMANLPLQACMGNHEGSGTLFMKYFPYPFVGARYWSFDYGPAHFTMIDQYVAYNPGSAQYNWIQNDLAATTRPWRFVVLHEPGWSAGTHGNNPSVQNYLQPLFVQYGVSAVFCGHNHYYARAVVDGIPHLTVGGGGAPLYTPDPNFPNVVTATRAYSYGRVTIDGAHLGFAAVNGTAVLDTFDIYRPSAVDPVPAAAAPVLKGASPNPFNPRTTISFSLPQAGVARLAVYDVAGHVVRTLADGHLDAGEHSVDWDGRDSNGRALASGSYFARLEAGGSVRSTRMSLVR